MLTTALTHCYELVVRGITCKCTRCGRDGIAVALIHTDTGGSEIFDEVGAEAGVTLGFAKELLEEVRHPAAATIKHRRSVDGGDRYLSNGCGRCDAMFDPFDLADAIAAVQDRREVGSLPVLARVSRTIAEWALLHELAQTSGFDED